MYTQIGKVFELTMTWHEQDMKDLAVALWLYCAYMRRKKYTYMDRPQLSIIISTLIYINKLPSFHVKFEQKLRPLNTGKRKGLQPSCINPWTQRRILPTFIWQRSQNQLVLYMKRGSKRELSLTILPKSQQLVYVN